MEIRITVRNEGDVDASITGGPSSLWDLCSRKSANFLNFYFSLLSRAPPPSNKKNASFGKPCSICIILLYTSYFVKFPSTIRYYKMFLMKNFNLRLILLIYLFIGTKVRFFWDQSQAMSSSGFMAKKGQWLADLSGLPIRGLFFGRKHLELMSCLRPQKKLTLVRLLKTPLNN